MDTARNKMPTISEIEAERAKILEEIENRAKQNAGNPNATLKDWLNAAKEVMPNNNQIPATPYENSEINNNLYSADTAFTENDFDEDVRTSFSQAMHQETLGNTPPPNNTNNALNASSGATSMKNLQATNGGFSIAALLLQISIFSIFAIILYFGYQNVTQQLVNIQTQTAEQIAALQESVNNTGGTDQIQTTFDQMDSRIAFLESQLTQIQEQLTEIQKQPQQQLDLSQLETLSTEDKTELQQTLAVKMGISEELLDTKLREYNEQLANQLEAKLDKKLQPILRKLNLNPQKTAVTVSTEPEAELISQPLAPQMPDVKPISEQPLLQMVAPKSTKLETTRSENESGVKTIKEIAPVAEIQKPTVETTKTSMEKTISPIKGVSDEDFAWLQNQPKGHYTLQLASMKTAEDLQRLIKSKNLPAAKILPQVRNGQVNYILLMESVLNRAQATNLANSIKKETGISPWIRKFQDIQAKSNL